MKLLPHWILTNKHAAFYDGESATVIEQTAKVYAAMQELITEYNAFVDAINENIKGFEQSTNMTMEEFKTCITNTVSNYINTLDMKVDSAVSYMKTNLRQTAESYLAEVINEFNEQILDFNDTKAAFEQRFEQFLTTSEATINAQNTSISTAIGNMQQTMDTQDAKVDEAVAYLQTNLQTTLSDAVTNDLNNGDITIGYVYDEETESLTFVGTQGGV